MILILDTCKYFNNIVKNLHDNIVKTTECKIVHDMKLFDTDNLFILFEIYKLDKMPKNYIIYNFEQLNIDREDNLYNEEFWNKFKNAKYVIDYSKSNIKLLKSKNIDTKFIPLGWNRYMKNKIITPFQERINHVMFIGYINKRRINILKPIHTLCKENDYNIFLSNDCWNDDYFHKLSIVKIAYNIHFYDGNTVLEVHRIIPYILNCIWVISEHSNDEWYDELFEGLVSWTNCDDIVEITNNVLNMSKDEVNQQLLNRQQLLIQRCSHNDYIKQITL